MKHILIPTDFSENAWNAIQFALAFFSNYKVNFVLAHIEHPNALSPALKAEKSSKTNEKLLANTVFQTLENYKEKMLESTMHNASTIVIDSMKSNFTEGIKHLIVKHKIDLIVMGTQGFSANKNKIIGKYAQSVITKIHCPVLVIPEKTKFKIPVNIAFPTDYSFIYKSKVLESLTAISNVHNSSIKVIRVVNPKMTLAQFQHKNRGYLKDYFKILQVVFTELITLIFQEGLQEFIDSMHIDMVAMIAKNLNFFEMLLFKSTVVKMSYHTNIPFGLHE